MKNPLVSIIMPVKNAAPFLIECLDSITHQSYQNWELIAINDHSSDSSLEILKNYEIRDNRIHVLGNKGSGIINALNIGYVYSKGELITRMDADDIMPLEKINSLVSALLKHGKGNIATGFVQYFSEETIGEGFLNYQLWLNSLTANNNHFNDIYKECPIASPCWMAWKIDFDNCGAFASETYPEDYDLVFRFYKQKYSCIGISKILHLWRDSPNRASRTDENYQDNRFLNLKINYFLEVDYDKNRDLILWGAGKKGKQIAKLLIENQISFQWICNTPNKIGKEISTKILQDCSLLPFENTQIIIAVANKVEQQNIQMQLDNSMDVKYFYFC